LRRLLCSLHERLDHTEPPGAALGVFTARADVAAVDRAAVGVARLDPSAMLLAGDVNLGTPEGLDLCVLDFTLLHGDVLVLVLIRAAFATRIGPSAPPASGAVDSLVAVVVEPVAVNHLMT
jgi:hypothetical protein